MRFDFLKAAGNVAISKEFTKTPDGFETKPYPFVKNFDSFSESVQTVEELFPIIEKHSKLGHTAIKGLLTQPLSNQSRAGKTVADFHTQWIMLDLDFEDGFNSIDEFLASLSPDLSDVSYIFQDSSSAGIKSKAGIRGHIFMMLEKTVSPLLIKEWLIQQNFDSPVLDTRIELASNSLSIKYPLDISTCQNDKLLFIADPICTNFKDPIQGQRLKLVTKSRKQSPITFNANAATNREKTKTKVDQLRTAKGLKKKSPKYKYIGQDEILSNPDEVIVTGVKTERGFTYINLNGGDSWAYYYPDDKPDIVYNFKGEPPVLLKDIAPEYWRNLKAQVNPQTPKPSTVPVVFRDLHSDTYWNGTYEPGKNKVDIYPVSSTQRIGHFLAQFGKTMPDFIEDWDLVFDPTTNKVIDFPNKWVNKFSPSVYMQQEGIPNIGIPPTIDKILTSVCGDDNASKEHFLNWLAYIFKYRKKSGTGFIFHGRTGTGKGVLFDKIIKPLLGDKYVNELIIDNLSDQFNQYLETSLILWIDEFNVGDSKGASVLMNKIKNLVTENNITIRGMRRNPVQRQVYNNIIIASNHADPIPMDSNDRRFNVPPAQEKMISLSQMDVAQIKNELGNFATYLQEFKVDTSKVNKVLDNKAKKQMILAGMTSHDAFFQAIRNGNLNYFIQYIREKAPLSPDNSYIEFEKAIKRWTACSDSTVTITREELSSAYAYLQQAKFISPTKFSRMCTINRLEMKTCKLDNKTVQGIQIDFKNTEETLKNTILKPNVIGLVNAK